MGDGAVTTGPRRHGFLFVGGSARSGTTLVQKMLCAHSRVAGGPEFDHAVPAMQLYERMSRPVQLERQQFYYNAQELADRFREFYASLFDGLVARHENLAYVSEKTPSNIAAAATLLSLFPEAFYINVVRDGRDVVASHQKVLQRFKQEKGSAGKRWWHEYSVRDVSRKWNGDIHRYRMLADNASFSSRVINIRYEDLVRDSKSVLQSLFERLKLPFEEATLCPENVAKEQLGYDANVDGIWYTDEMFQQRVGTQSIAKWKRELPHRKRWLAEFMLCENLQAMGYEVSPRILKCKRWFDRLRGRGA